MSRRIFNHLTGCDICGDEFVKMNVLTKVTVAHSFGEDLYVKWFRDLSFLKQFSWL